MRYVIVYDDDDMIGANELADHFGYSRDHVRAMLNIQDRNADPALIRLRIETTREWRQANGMRARIVFRYADAKAWYEQRQRKPTVRRQKHNRKHTPQQVN